MIKKSAVILFSLSFILPHNLKSDTFNLNDKFYLGFGAGILMPEDVDIKKTEAGIVNGVNISANLAGTFKFDNGYQLSGILGYRYNEFFSLESEIAYSNFDYDQVNITVAGTATSGGTTFTGTANRSYEVDGSISAFSMIFGPSVDIDIVENLELIVGGGIGFTNHNDEVKSIGGSSGFAYDEDFTNFTTKFKTGLNYSLSSVSYIQAEYGYNFIDSGIENYSDDFTAHSLAGRLVFNF